MNHMSVASIYNTLSRNLPRQPLEQLEMNMSVIMSYAKRRSREHGTGDFERHLLAIIVMKVAGKAHMRMTCEKAKFLSNRGRALFHMRALLVVVERTCKTVGEVARAHKQHGDSHAVSVRQLSLSLVIWYL